MTLPKNRFFTNPSILYLILILSLALGLRLWGIRFGLPYPYHPDEEKYVLMALKMGKFGLNPHYFVNPTLYTYLLFLVYILFYFAGHIFGLFHSPVEFITKFVNDPTLFYMTARCLNVTFAVLTVYYLYKIGKYYFSQKPGIIAAFLLSVVLLPVRDAHFGVPDTTMVCFITISFYYLVRFSKEKLSKHALLFGLFLGLATATKYTAAFLLFSFIALLFQQKDVLQNKKLLLLTSTKVCLFILLGFIFGCPYSILDFKSFRNDIRQVSFFSETGWFGVNSLQSGYLFYLNTLRWGMGLPILGLSIISFFYLFYKNRKVGFLIFTFPIVYYLYMGYSHLQFERFILPVIPFLILGVTVFLVKIAEQFSLSNIVISMCVLLISLIPWTNSLRLDYLFTQKDTRTEAKEWIEDNLQENSKIAMDGYGPKLYIAHPKLFDFLKEPPVNSKFDVVYLGRFGLGLYTLDYYKSQKFNYLISTDYTYERYFSQKDLYPKETQFYTELDYKARLIHIFSPYKDNYHPPFRLAYITGPSEFLFQFKQPGPLIKIYALD